MHNQPIKRLNQSELGRSNTPCLPKPIGILTILNMRVSPYTSTPLIATLACDATFPSIQMGTIKAIIRMEKYG